MTAEARRGLPRRALSHLRKISSPGGVSERPGALIQYRHRLSAHLLHKIAAFLGEENAAFLRGAYQYLLAPGVCIMLLCLAFYLISLWLTARKETILET